MKRRTVIKGAAASVALFAVSGPVFDALQEPRKATGLPLAQVEPNQRWYYPLTPRQAQVSELVAAGLTTKEIAKSLWITENTTEYHVHGIFLKFALYQRSQIGDWVALNRPARRLMSSREFQLAALIAAGFTNGEIARHFGNSEHTIEAHVQRIAMTMDFHRRAQIGDWVASHRRVGIYAYGGGVGWVATAFVRDICRVDLGHRLVA